MVANKKQQQQNFETTKQRMYARLSTYGVLAKRSLLQMLALTHVALTSSASMADSLEIALLS
jgi:hypothetical protein